uniref:Cyclin-dependent protein kinase regulator n=1 Tax=Kwoniella dejecticola CBS 10117 TaxID=1296121 RepID=A0A1A6A0J3_9TREE|nr:cyclin-dependent protein kinase regulator [Kwoniella dejecticola CBS 10117]OBR83592.1 cyclin-dependent protein kinase regulator [Kwoniella dejecticola CBS 10117]
MAHAPHPLATLNQITNTPSAKDGVPKEVEDDLRTAGCMLIQEAGVMLGLPQNTMATAQVIFHRFYYVSSLYSFGVNDISISSLFLSTKLCETPIRLRDLINTYLFLLARIQYLLNLPPDTAFRSNPLEQDPIWDGFTFEIPGFHDGVFWEWKDVITASEMQILKRLGFNMQVDLPYSHMINYLKILDLVFEDEVAQVCWSILNDMLMTPMYAIHPPHTLACAAILLATRLLRISLPTEWYILFDAEYEDIWSCSCHVMKLYHDWGLDRPRGSVSSGSQIGGGEQSMRDKENRWRRAWVLTQSRKAVRRWLEEREKTSERKSS